MRSQPPAYLTPYHKAQGQHGSGFGVTLWANPRSQRVRFQVMTEMVFFYGKRVLDAGCSRGDFAVFLLERNLAYEKFIGVDGVCELIDHAQERDLPRAAFHCQDFVTDPRGLAIGDPQIVTISGSLNTMDEATALAVLEAAWEAAGEALIFNFLSDTTGPGAFPQQAPARRLPTMTLMEWALHKTWAVQFRQDYFPHGHDATILMQKPEALGHNGG
jgi:SAM-dependent methyltransferase